MAIIRETQRQVRKVFSTAFWLFTLLFGFIAVLFSTTTGRSDETTLTVPSDGVWIAHADAPGGGYGGDSGDSEGGDNNDDDDADDNSSCFASGTPVTMADGTTQEIETIKPGDLTKGGRVTGVMQFLVSAGAMYEYRGVIVTGTHPVNDEGTWRYVSESPLAKPCADTENRYTYLLNCTGHRVYVNGVEFSDYIEISPNEPIKATYLKQLMQYHQRKEDLRCGKPIASAYFQKLISLYKV